MKKSVSTFLALAGLALGAQTLSLTAADWPQWRGPNRDGISSETGLLKQWPAGGPPLLWKAAGLGSGYSGVAVVGKMIYTLGDKGESNYVIALNLDSGKPAWSTPLGRAGAPGWGGFAGPRCIPTVDGGLLFAVGQYGQVACLDSASGAVKWRREYKEFGGELPEWGYTGMPLVDGDKVILTPGGKQGNVIALNKRTGELLWQASELNDGIHYSSPIVEEIDGVRQYIQLTDARLAGISASDGKLLWSAKRKGATAVIPTPIYDDHYVYVTSEYNIGCNLFKINHQDNQFRADQVYANKVMLNQHGGVIKLGDYIYGYSSGGPNKGWVCQEFKTGKVVWQERDKLGKGSIAYADGRFYLRAEDGKGTVALIEATPEAYREKGRFDQPNRSEKNSWAHPVISGAKLFLRDQDILLCYDLMAN